jgi:hypothetical protein
MVFFVLFERADSQTRCLCGARNVRSTDDEPLRVSIG